jgi:pre-rRNA-processing protein TSR3
MNAHLIKRYRTCTTSEDIVAMQELIQAEQVRDAELRKREKRQSPTPSHMWSKADHTGAYDDGDLLRSNPNHQDWDEPEDEGDKSEEEADEVETLTMALGQTSIESPARA